MPDKDGINTDEADKESYEAAEEYTAQRIAEEWSSTELRKRYENLKMVTLKDLPNLWPGLVCALCEIHFEHQGVYPPLHMYTPWACQFFKDRYS